MRLAIEAASGTGFVAGVWSTILVVFAIWVLINGLKIIVPIIFKRAQNPASIDGPLGDGPQHNIPPEVLDDGAAALKSIGYNKKQVDNAIVFITEEHGDCPDFQTFMELALQNGAGV